MSCTRGARRAKECAGDVESGLVCLLGTPCSRRRLSRCKKGLLRAPMKRAVEAALRCDRQLLLQRVHQTNHAERVASCVDFARQLFEALRGESNIFFENCAP